jgi:membrane associated rhomboid family serine protease
MFGFQQPQRNTGEILKQIFLSKSVLSRLMLINVSVFLLVGIINVFMFIFGVEVIADPANPIVRFLALPSSLSALLTKPWTLFSYMFLHEGFFHVFVNLIMIYVGGIIFLQYMSETKLFWTYILGGLMGAVFFLIAFNTFNVFAGAKDHAVLLGASASALAILIAVATYVPDYTIQLLLIGRVKLKYVAIAFVAIDILSIPYGNAGGHIGHLGGAFWGFIYAFYLRKGNDFYKVFDNLNMPNFGGKTRQAKFDTFRQEGRRPMDDITYNSRKQASQEQIDRILDKISKAGYESLSKEEKEMLFKSSKK